MDISMKLHSSKFQTSYHAVEWSAGVYTLTKRVISCQSWVHLPGGCRCKEVFRLICLWLVPVFHVALIQLFFLLSKSIFFYFFFFFFKLMDELQPSSFCSFPLFPFFDCIFIFYYYALYLGFFNVFKNCNKLIISLFLYLLRAFFFIFSFYFKIRLST